MVKIIAKKLGIIPPTSKNLRKPSNLPYHFLRIEGLFITVLSLYYYFFVLKAHWLLFVLLLMAPDLALFAYAMGEKMGAVVYDVFHTYTIPAVLLLGSLYFGWAVVAAISVIWIIHIAQDRMRGFGMKYTETYQGTHMNNI